MREILFRGQTRKYGEKVNYFSHEKLPGRWVYGGVLQGESSHSIIYGTDNPDFPGVVNRFAVHTDTLGQYTGLTDKNGKRIFEGDIVQGDNFWHKNLMKYQVAFDEGCFFLVDDSGHFWHKDHIENVEVIGNIHDNPELLAEVEG